MLHVKVTCLYVCFLLFGLPLHLAHLCNSFFFPRLNELHECFICRSIETTYFALFDQRLFFRDIGLRLIFCMFLNFSVMDCAWLRFDSVLHVWLKTFLFSICFMYLHFLSMLCCCFCLKCSVGCITFLLVFS